jgi:hypothetical protein
METNMNNQLTPIQELRKIEQIQTKLLLGVNTSLKKEIEEYLKQQKNILEVENNEELKNEMLNNMLEAFFKFAERVVLHEERENKVKNNEEITAQDLDYQYLQVNLFNVWATKQMELYYKLKHLYYSQKAKKYQD